MRWKTAGIGFPSDDKKKVLADFQRITSSASEKFKEWLAVVYSDAIKKGKNEPPLQEILTRVTLASKIAELDYKGVLRKNLAQMFDAAIGVPPSTESKEIIGWFKGGLFNQEIKPSFREYAKDQFNIIGEIVGKIGGRVVNFFRF